MENTNERYLILAWNGNPDFDGEDPDGADYGETNTSLSESKAKYEKLCKQYDHVQLATTENGWYFDVIIMEK